MKFDNHGLGHDAGEEFANNWWENIFNKAAQNVNVQVNDNQIRMQLNSKKSIDITNKRICFENYKGLEYGSFIKTEKLTGTRIHHFDKVPENTYSTNNFQALTDDELFAACGGRTAHKAARHGLKLNGKLSRIEKQEKMLLKKMRKVSLSDSEKDDNVTQKKLRKLKKQKESEKFESLDCWTQNSSSLKKKKTVSFNETVTKIYTADLDTSFESEVNSVKDENSNDPNLENLAGVSDEGKDYLY